MQMKFEGNVGGAWRWLDKDLLGWVPLKAVDEESSDILHSFKEWAETRFGTVDLAFKNIGGGNAAGAFSYHEMRIACAKYKWVGNARVLFDCLTQNGETVSFKDAKFLTTWAGLDAENIQSVKTCVHTLWKEMLELSPAARPTAPRKYPFAVCEGTLPVGEGPSRSIAWGGRNLGSPLEKTRPLKISVAELLDSLEDEDNIYESTLHGDTHASISSLPESMYSLPDTHCSPRAAFLGVPYARPVVNPLVTTGQKAHRRHATSKLSKSCSQSPMREESSHALYKSGSQPVSGKHASLPKQKSLHSRMGNLFKSTGRSSGPSRKKDLIGSLSGSSPLLESMPFVLEET